MPFVINIVLFLLATTYCVSATQKTLYIQFKGLVDPEESTDSQFCPALWVTFAGYNWTYATTYCASITTDYRVGISLGSILTAQETVDVTVSNFQQLTTNLTTNLQYSGYLTISPYVVWIADFTLNKPLCMGLVGMIFGVLTIVNLSIFVSGWYLTS